MNPLHRRNFLGMTIGAGAASAVGGVPALAAAASSLGARHPDDDHRGLCCIASGNGLNAVNKAMELLKAPAGDGSRAADPAAAVVAGVNLVENDPNDSSVGYGGLPNEEGIVELDASVMHGPLHRAGCVAGLRNIKNPSSVALTVLRRTDHVLLVGEGALRFARMHGFKEENLLTEAARLEWLKWKENMSKQDDWLNDDEKEFPSDPIAPAGQPRAEAITEHHPDGLRTAAGGKTPWKTTTGTVNCLAVTAGGDLGGCTSTSGLSYKIPGRIGDSPIIGAGLYVDNAIGAAGATGRGEAMLQNCGSFAIVELMGRGMTPTEACQEVILRICKNTREKRLLDDQKRPNFQLILYALRKDGAYGSAALWHGEQFAVHDTKGARLVDSPGLYKKE